MVVLYVNGTCGDCQKTYSSYASLPLSLPLPFSLPPSPFLPLSLPLSLSYRLTQVLSVEHNSKAMYYMCELHYRGGSRITAKKYCNMSLEFSPNASRPLYDLGVMLFGMRVK